MTVLRLVTTNEIKNDELRTSMLSMLDDIRQQVDSGKIKGIAITGIDNSGECIIKYKADKKCIIPLIGCLSATKNYIFSFGLKFEEKE